MAARHAQHLGRGPAGNAIVTTPQHTALMACPRARSAALLISVHVDARGGAPWYAQLRAFDDPESPEVLTERVSDEAELILAVRRWLGTVLGRP
jgi:hypothetical protein